MNDQTGTTALRAATGGPARILAFAGSSRPDSVNRKLVDLAARTLEGMGARVTVIDLASFDLPFIDARHYGDGAPEGAKRLRKLADEHDGFFISSPEYNAGYTAELKNALDAISVARPSAPGTSLSGKVIALGGVSPGTLGAYRGLTQLRTSLELGFGALLTPEMVSVANAGDAFKEDGSLKDERSAGFLGAALKRLLTLVGDERARAGQAAAA